MTEDNKPTNPIEVFDKLDKLAGFLSSLTIKRIIYGILFALAAIGLYTVYENRQALFVEWRIPKEGKYKLIQPNEKQDAMINDYLTIHPEVSQISILDADPVKNYRTTIKNYFKHRALGDLYSDLSKERPISGPLFSSDEKNNSQIIKILSSEITCNPSDEGFYGSVFPEITKYVVYSCRVPVPPAYGKVTGWFSIHFNRWPLKDFERAKYEMLVLSRDYYDEELKK